MAGGFILLIVVIKLFVNTDSQYSRWRDNNTIRIGYLQTDLGPTFRGAAINLAIDRAQADGLLPGKNFRFAQFLYNPVKKYSFVFTDD